MKTPILKSRFPSSLFFAFFGILLLMSGLHTALLVLMFYLGIDHSIQLIAILAYWLMVALGLTLYTRSRIQKTYEIPMQNLAVATRRVASGDFSVYVPPLHLEEKADYLDKMILDFNKMVEELGSIETLKTDFFSNVSHELKTPLSVIQSNASLLQKYGDDPEKREEYTDHIIQYTKRLSTLISNMLKLNKLEKQTILPQSQPFDLCQQLCGCALQFEDLWEKKNIEFEAELEDRLTILADAGLLGMVWNNLLSNAMKFTQEGGTIKLRQQSGPDGILISVTDSGCGMSIETQKHIFDKFYQGDTSHSTEGNGLGLPLAKRIVELMDGAITAESSLGSGSTFTVTLPAKLIMTGETEK